MIPLAHKYTHAFFHPDLKHNCSPWQIAIEFFLIEWIKILKVEKDRMEHYVLLY